MSLEQILTKEFLSKLYIEEQLTIAKIAKMVDSDPKAISRRLKQLGIPIRNLKEVASLVDHSKGNSWKVERVADVLTKEYLEEKYTNQNLSMGQIASEIGCDLTTIQNYMKKFCIPRRTIKESAKFTNFSHGNWNGNNVRSILTKEFLQREYVELRKSIKQIAEENNIKSTNSVSQYLKKFKLYRTDKKNSADIYTKEFLEEYYVRQNLSLKDVALKVGNKSKAVVKRWLLFHGIPIRDVTVSSKVIKNRNRNRGEFFSSRYWDGVHTGATQRGIQLLISKEFAYNLFLKQGGKCAISGVRIFLLWDTDVRTASLDRIDSSGHYTEDNVQWVHRDVNQMKMDSSDEELINWCHIISDFNRNKLC